jgi:hypothetical protein
MLNCWWWPCLISDQQPKKVNFVEDHAGNIPAKFHSQVSEKIYKYFPQMVVFYQATTTSSGGYLVFHI